ncbi:GC-rich sequence DNA-binding factor-like protein-domain-containing protein [Dissophora ornata]|nr:hypothetical protein BGZ58_007161 [Dissophora ornata]KAI8606454.1 GC-rich sequence DNA-binding factor-like protein-domain-containing protein [Dissophora ornata]
MARNKHVLDDAYSSSDDEPQDRGVTQRDLQDEMDQFRDPMNRSRRKRPKEDAIYGSFYDWGSEDEGAASRSGGSRSRTRRREGFEFVPASSSGTQSKTRTSDIPDRDSSDSGDEHMDSDRDGRTRGSVDDSEDNMDVDSGDEDDDHEDEDEDEEGKRTKRESKNAFKAQRERDQEEIDAFEDRAQRPQMGLRPSIGVAPGTPSLGQGSPVVSPVESGSTPSNNKAMAASIRAGLGLSTDAGTTTPVDGSPRSQQRNKNNNYSSLSFFKNRANFNGDGSSPSSPSPRPASPASVSSPRPDTPVVAPVKVDKDYGAFSAKGSGFGLKMLEKMGWKKGYGLGAGGSGIVEPIQTKQRPVKMGIGFKGFKEKTDQTRAEEKRRGVGASSDEGEEPGKQKSKGGDKKEQEPKADGWKKTSGRGSRKGPKIEYKTAEEIQRDIESADMPMTQVQPQKILDMTGKTVRELSSASQISSSVPFHHERFPELRHNLQLMADISTTDLEQLARTQKADHIRQKVLDAEGQRMQKLVVQDEIDLERLSKVMTITDQCTEIADEIRQATSDTTGEAVVEIKEDYIAKAFQDPFELFSGIYFVEYELYQLDQVVVAAIQDSFKRLLRDWDVLKNPTLGAGLFQRWQKLLKTSKVVYNDDRDTGSFYGSKLSHPEQMTAYESLLNQHWLPKVRSAINNRWNPRDCDPVIELLEAWTPPLLPAFIHDNIITQLILPKLHKEVEQWSPRDSPMLHTWIHPWLPVLGESRLDQELFGDIRRKLGLGLTSWNVLDPSALRVLEPWRGVFEASDMEVLLLKSVLPKLVEGLQMFEINPRNQQIEILQAVLPWHHFFPSTTFSSLFVNEFFPKWHQVLYLWLTHPSTPDLDQISQWYQWWKSLFPAELAQETGVATGFRQGLDMINQSMAGLKIMAPADVAQGSRTGGSVNGSSSDSLGRLQTKKHLVASVSFKDLVQDYATQNSLLFVMTKQTHERSGRPLYRLGGNSTGTAGGILVHMTDEVAFVQAEDAGTWIPTGLEELMVLAGAGKNAGKGGGTRQG